MADPKETDQGREPISPDPANEEEWPTWGEKGWPGPRDKEIEANHTGKHYVDDS